MYQSTIILSSSDGQGGNPTQGFEPLYSPRCSRLLRIETSADPSQGLELQFLQLVNVIVIEQATRSMAKRLSERALARDRDWNIRAFQEALAREQSRKERWPETGIGTADIL
ncbi:MAG TPA: hypothetical protein VFV38_24590 [Ktedonobacteraceae bacterium]|nr:hypothetical protein [Ktedonobacteraceae bacterium]